MERIKDTDDEWLDKLLEELYEEFDSLDLDLDELEEEKKNDICSLTNLCEKLNGTDSNICKDFLMYQKGRLDAIDEIIKMVEDMKLKAFLTIANTGDAALDVTYEILGNYFDKLVKQMKKE